MKIKILGSGGYLRIPRALCQCKICVEARQKAYPYKRLGQALYLEEIKTLFDTPEDINEILNNSDVTDIKRIVHSHWHPDHVLGARIVEVLRDDKNHLNPIDFFVAKEEKAILPMLNFFETLNYCKIINYTNINEIIIDEKIKVERLIMKNNFSSAFLFSENNKKVLYCPCHGKELILNENYLNLDLLIMNLGTLGFEEEGSTSFIYDNIRIIKEIKPKKVIFTHIEERYKLSYDDYKKMEDEYKELNIYFAYDNMEVEV